MPDSYHKFMQRALDLAAQGLGRVSPNPMVGAIVVHDNLVIGEGWHREYGGPHAEVNAVNAVTARNLLKESILFVNLEPCSHYGQTPPCADMIISSGIRKVVIANRDPNPLVAGQGIAKLRERGVEVIEGVMEDAGAYLNRRFFTFHQKHRPYIILKWAQTKDGYIARTDYQSKWISNEYSRQLAHQYRAQEDAIMVGRNTAQYDDPELSVRQWIGQNPLRVVLDPHLVLNRELKLFDGSVSTLCYNYVRNENGSTVELKKLPEDRFLEDIGSDLYGRNVQSLLVEGGGRLLSSLLHRDYWDEARVFIAPKTFGSGIKAPRMLTAGQQERNILGDLLITYYNQNASN